MNTRVQVKLLSDTSVRTCWVEPIVKVGDSITLKNSENPEQLWTVLSVSAPKLLSQINQSRDWKVGGL